MCLLRLLREKSKSSKPTTIERESSWFSIPHLVPCAMQCGRTSFKMRVAGSIMTKNDSKHEERMLPGYNCEEEDEELPKYDSEVVEEVLPSYYSGYPVKSRQRKLHIEIPSAIPANSMYLSSEAASYQACQVRRLTRSLQRFERLIDTLTRINTSSLDKASRWTFNRYILSVYEMHSFLGRFILEFLTLDNTSDMKEIIRTSFPCMDWSAAKTYPRDMDNFFSCAIRSIDLVEDTDRLDSSGTFWAVMTFWLDQERNIRED